MKPSKSADAADLQKCLSAMEHIKGKHIKKGPLTRSLFVYLL